MASGPCGSEFKDAFSCFHYSKEEVKGSECLEQFRAMQECIQRYPELYPQEDDVVSEEKSSETEQASQNSAPAETSEANSTSAPVQDSDPTQPNTENSVESSWWTSVSLSPKAVKHIYEQDTNFYFFFDVEKSHYLEM